MKRLALLLAAVVVVFIFAVIGLREANRPAIEQSRAQTAALEAITEQVTQLAGVMERQLEIVQDTVGALVYLPYLLVGGFVLLAGLNLAAIVLIIAYSQRTLRTVLEAVAPQLAPGQRSRSQILPNPDYIDVEPGSWQERELLALGYRLAGEYEVSE